MSSSKVDIRVDGFGLVPKSKSLEDGQDGFDIIRRYTMTNKSKASVRLITWGAGIQSISVPNKHGILDDVVLGYNTMEGYLKNRYIGRVIGRVVNRISGGLISIDNTIHHLTLNDRLGKNHYNGGVTAFDNVNWDSCVLNNQVIMSHLSRPGNEGYPGYMLTQVKYSWTDNNELRVDIRATATESTPVNVALHCLMNLAGHGAGADEMKKHVITVNAAGWTYADVKDHLPTGDVCEVDSTVYDLRVPTLLTKDRLYDVPGGGYNHHFCVSSPGCWCYRFHARIIHPGSGRLVEIYSNHPGLYFYTGNDLPDPDRVYPPDFENHSLATCTCNDSPHRFSKSTSYEKFPLDIEGKDGIRYRRHGGFILSPENYPDAVNIKHFPSCILYPGKVYTHEMSYKFGTIS